MTHTRTYCVYVFQADVLERETVQLKETLVIEKQKHEQDSEEMQIEMVSIMYVLVSQI